LAPFFAYYSLVSSADSQIKQKQKKQKHQYFGAKICYLPFCLYFLSFFPAIKKFRQKRERKLAQKGLQLKINLSRLFLN